MEYEFYIQLLANTTEFNENLVDPETSNHFIDWMRETPDLAYQYANQFLVNMPSPRYKTYEENDYQDI